MWFRNVLVWGVEGVGEELCFWQGWPSGAGSWPPALDASFCWKLVTCISEEQGNNNNRGKSWPLLHCYISLSRCLTTCAKNCAPLVCDAASSHLYCVQLPRISLWDTGKPFSRQTSRFVRLLILRPGFIRREMQYFYHAI